MTDFTKSRRQMVDTQLRTNDVTDGRVLDAMQTIPREKFVPASKQAIAYIDDELAMNTAGTRFLVKPHVTAKLIQEADIQSDDVVLVVGAGTGYAASVISYLAASVVALEEDEHLSEASSQIILSLGIENVVSVQGKLTEGYPSEGPYDVIFVAGAVDVLPETLFDQLKDGGRLVVVEGRGGAAQATLYVNSERVHAPRFLFNASTAMLPGFEKPEEFVF